MSCFSNECAGFNFVQVPDLPLDFMSARFIQEEATSASKCKFEGILVYHDNEARTVQAKDIGSSPKRRRSDFSVLDVILLDLTGPTQVTLFGDELVSSFLQQVHNSAHSPEIVSLSVARVSYYQLNGMATFLHQCVCYSQ